MSFLTMTVFFRTEMHKRSVEDGGIYTGALFFGVTTIMFNGFSELSMTIAKLPVFYKQRDFLFYPSWAYTLPSSSGSQPGACQRRNWSRTSQTFLPKLA